MADVATISVDDEVLGAVANAVTPSPTDAVQEQASVEPVAQESTQQAYFSFAGQDFVFPSDWDDAKRDAALRRYVNTNEFRGKIDRNREGSFTSRVAVGSVSDPQDKLNTVRQYYPDALPYGDGNFVFTDPETGLPTLLDKSGFTMGDVGEYTRDIAIGVGGTLGGVAGSLFPGIGTYAGGGFGTYATASVYDFLAENILGVQRDAGFVERVAGLTTESLMAVSGQKVGEIVMPVVSKQAKQLLGGGRAASQRVYELAQKHGIVPTAGMTTGGRGAGRVERMLQNNIASSSRMTDQAAEVVESAATAAKTLAEKIGKPRTQQGTGEVIQTAIEKATTKFTTQQSKLEAALDDAIGEDFGIGVDEVTILRDELKAAAEGAKRTLGPMYSQAISLLDNMIADAAENGGKISYRTLRDIRTSIGKRMSDMNEGAINKTMFKRIYASVTADIENAIKAADPKLAAQFDETMAYTRDFMETTKGLFDKLAEYDAPEQAYRYLMGSMKDGGSRIKVLFDQFSADEQKDIAATVINKMGYQNFGNEADEFFSFATFINNYKKKLSDEAKDILFGAIDPNLRQSLDELVEVFGAMANNQRLTNYSNTAEAMHGLQSLDIFGNGVVDVLMGAATGQPPIQASQGLVRGVVSRIVLPNTMARGLIHPAFIKWLASTADSGAGIGGHIGRLGAVVADNPELREPVAQYLSVLSQRAGYDINLQEDSGQ